jgi:hypothetical protein
MRMKWDKIDSRMKRIREMRVETGKSYEPGSCRGTAGSEHSGCTNVGPSFD